MPNADNTRHDLRAEGPLMALDRLEDYFPDWKEREALAEAMIPIIGRLYRKNVVVYCYGRALHNQSVTDIMKTHRFVRQVAENELSEFESYPILEAMSRLDLGPSHVDVGKMAVEYMERTGRGERISAFVFTRQACAHIIGRHVKPLSKPRDVVLFGFGRIGRLLARLLIEKTGGGDQLVLRAVVLRPGRPDDISKRAALLRRDSVHGAFGGTIRVDEENQCLIANGIVIRMIYAEDRGNIDYTAYGIDDALLIDNSGVWRDEEGLGEHLKSNGVSRVMVTAPGKGNIKNIVSGVNSHLVEDSDQIVSCASCTTNAIVPVLKAVNDQWGVVHGHMETVHAYTPDQNLHDNYHAKNRRGRSAPLNMVITGDWCFEGGRQVTAGTRRQADGECNPRTHAERVAGDFEALVAVRGEPRRGECLLARNRIEFVSAAADRLHLLAGVRVERLHWQPPRMQYRRRCHDRGWQPHRSVRLVRQRIRLCMPGRPGGAEVGGHSISVGAGRGPNRVR